jgi:hypothetical protein
MDRTRKVLMLGLFLGAMAMVACSPEGSRTRSGGQGADIGNRGTSVELHGQLNPYFETPRLAPAPAR